MNESRSLVQLNKDSFYRDRFNVNEMINFRREAKWMFDRGFVLFHKNFYIFWKIEYELLND